MSSPSRNNESDDRQMPRPTGASLPTQETNSPSFGEGSGNSMTPDQPDRQNAERMVPMSDNLLSTQLSLGTGTSQSRSVIQRRNRGDVQATGALDRYLASDLPSSNLNSNRGRDLSSAQDVDVPAPVIWGTTISLEDAMTMFKGFITNYAQEDSEDAYYSELLAYMNQNQIYSMNLDCQKLKDYEHSTKLYHQLVTYPQEVIPLMDHVLTEIFVEKFPDTTLMEDQMLKVRPYNLPRIVNLRELDPEDVDQLVTVKGLMIRTTTVMPDMKKAFFRCSVCDHTIEVDNDRGRIAEPTACANNNCKSSNTMMLIHNRCTFSDKQVCRLQEIPDETPDGQTPYTVTLFCYDDLVDVAKPGDRLEITGIYRASTVRTNPNRRENKSLLKTFVDVVHVKKTNKQRVSMDKSVVNDNEYIINFEEGDQAQKDQEDESVEELIKLSKTDGIYDLLAQSVAPSIFGMKDVKKGCLLQLFGGSNKLAGNQAGSPRIRGDINILICGDPGVSKSQLLQYVHKLAPRGIYTSGKGSSAVGLTASVLRDPDTRQLVLESGALVLSDGGICCIDEFDKMNESTRSVLHEVMEQQTISIAKAGIITTLNARASILASANPINSKFDKNLSVPENVNLPPPLMSRFDLLYILLDKPNEKDDRKLGQHLVTLYLSNRPVASSENFIPAERFTKYINYAKTITPEITEEAGEALVASYISMRKIGSVGGGNTISFTTRQLESMIRLSEAHAKMRLSSYVEKQDVDEAHRLLLAALQTSAIDPRTGRIDLDLVTTGISASSRQRHEQKRNAVKNVLKEIKKESIRWAEAYRQFNEQSDEKLSEFEFNSVLRDLSDEGFLSMSGRTNADRLIQKLKPQF